MLDVNGTESTDRAIYKNKQKANGSVVTDSNSRRLVQKQRYTHYAEWIEIV